MRYYTIEVCGDLLEDADGNTLRFATLDDAKDYIWDNELDEAEIVKQ